MKILILLGLCFQITLADHILPPRESRTAEWEEKTIQRYGRLHVGEYIQGYLAAINDFTREDLDWVVSKINDYPNTITRFRAISAIIATLQERPDLLKDGDEQNILEQVISELKKNRASPQIKDREVVQSVFSRIKSKEFYAPEFEALAREWSDHEDPRLRDITGEYLEFANSAPRTPRTTPPHQSPRTHSDIPSQSIGSKGSDSSTSSPQQSKWILSILGTLIFAGLWFKLSRPKI